MLEYIIKQRQGRYLVYGIIFIIIGFVLSYYGIELSRYAFYLSIYFLGYYATINAVVDTIENRKFNVDLLMILAALGAVVINYESEGAMLLLIFAGAEVLEDVVSQKSSNAISELMKQVPEEAKLLQTDGSTITVKTEKLKIGDIVLVSKGDQIPIDGYSDRDIVVNEASLTGESEPVTKESGEEVFAGTINEGDSFRLEVSKEKKDTVFSNIIRMVEEAQSKPSNRERFINRLESKYVTVVLIAVPIFIAVLYFLRSYSFNEAFYRGMVLLTVASPCALVASATPATLSAISNSAKNGILFKDAQALELMKDLKYLATDKTGTLTYGEFEVVDYEIPEDILKKVVYIENNSNHPIAKSIVKKFSDVDLSDVEDSNIEEIAGAGLKMGDIIIGKPGIFKDYKDPNGYLSMGESVHTKSIVAEGNTIVGCILLVDTIRESAKEAINNFKKEDVLVEMLTGDNEAVATKVAEKLGLEHYRYNCYPEDKMKFIEEKQAQNHIVAMIGDGINDAPALANADIGIGMGDGSSIAMESSDMVVVKNNLNKIYFTYGLSKKLSKIVKQNIFFSVSVIITLIIVNILGILDLPSGVVFHEGSTILVILNGLRLLYYKGE